MVVPVRMCDAVVGVDSEADLCARMEVGSERQHRKEKEKYMHGSSMGEAAQRQCSDGVRWLPWSGCSEIGSMTCASPMATSGTYA
jgi:hypothetical protein